MLQCATSLWSADLTQLAAEIRRVEPFSERFHLDVADGHYVKNLLFFPDLVRALRPHSRKPFEVHLMTEVPLTWVEPFAEAGADVIIFSLGARGDPGDVLRAIKSHRRQAGIALRLEDGIDELEPYWESLDIVTLLGTPMAIKGASMAIAVPEKIRQARAVITRRKLCTLIEADGGIRRETVPLLHAAGADLIVPGSLMFKEEPAALRQWLASL